MNEEQASVEQRLIQQGFSVDPRALREQVVHADLVIVGGGMAGTCAAVSAARAGLKVALVQDRPVLGGNASSEVRLWILGATSHMGNNNRWSREGGVIGEFLEENVYRNPEGNPLLVDALLLEMVNNEPNIELFLNTSIDSVVKSAAETVASCSGFCSQNSTRYTFRAPFFMDASGDGVIAFLAGAAFRMGAESASEWGELMAPDDSYGYLLGHSLYFYSKDTGVPVEFHPPAFAGMETEKIARHRSIQLGQYGCRLWWVEYGGRKDTVHDTEAIKWELWKVVYGIWDYIKNSGNYPEAATHTLEWVGTIPGKRESRRFEGRYMLKQQDIVQRREFADVITHGGWALDLHPADGLYSRLPGCNQWHSKGVYAIPLRCYLANDISNLVLAGRIISASHVAFASTRVMATCASGAQAAAQAVVTASQRNIRLAELLEPQHLAHLQQDLLRAGHYLPGVRWNHADDLSSKADWSVSSEYRLQSIPQGDQWIELNESMALLLPVAAGQLPCFTLRVKAATATQLELQIRTSERADEYTPENTLATTSCHLHGGEQEISWQPDLVLNDNRYVFLTLLRCAGVHVLSSNAHISALTLVYNGKNKAVGNDGRQNPPDDVGVDRFDFWCPRRRPHPQLPSLNCSKPAYTFDLAELRNGHARPTATPGCWIADFSDPQPQLSLCWPQPVTVHSVILMFDADFDNAMESVLQGHSDRVAPMCVRNLRITDECGNELAQRSQNRNSYVRIDLPEPCRIRELHIQLQHPAPLSPAALFHLSVH